MDKLNFETNEKSKEGKAIKRSLIHLSIVFFLIYTPYRCLECIQSSLNFENGLGALSIGVLQGGNFVSCLLIGAPFVYTFGPKWSMFISFFTYTIFIAANFVPNWITLMPSSVLAGVMSGMIWIAQGTYLTILAQRYAQVSSEGIGIILPKFSAVFHLFWGASSPVGNLLASVVLGFKDNRDKTRACSQRYVMENGTKYTENNFSSPSNASFSYRSLIISELDNATLSTSLTDVREMNNSSNCGSEVEKSRVCGLNHCPYMVEHLSVLERPSDTLVYILLSIFLLFSILGIVVCAFMENISSPKNSTAREKLLKTIKLLKNVDLILMIIPFTLVGMLPGMFYGSFAQSFVSCVFGIGDVGYSLMCEGIGFTVACLICGPLTRVISRQAQFCFVFITLIAIALSWLLWVPSKDQFLLVIVMSLLFGLDHGLHRTHSSAMTSLLFPNDPEPAFAHYHLGRTFALCVTFLISPVLCFSAKAYFFLGSVCLAALSHLALEIRLKYTGRDITIVTVIDVEDNKVKETFLPKSKQLNSVLGSEVASLSCSCADVTMQT